MSINLETLVDQLGTRLGVGSEVGAKLPANRRKLVLLRSSQLSLAQNGIKGLRGLSFVLPLLVVLMYLGALALAAGYRRRVLIEIGVGIIAGALVALVLRRWVESYVVSNLVQNEGVRPAMREVLDIATAGWRSRALWLLITGVVVIFAGWLAGPMRWAVKIRELIADPLEHHPGWFAAGAAAIVLLIASLGPERTPGPGDPAADRARAGGRRRARAAPPDRAGAGRGQGERGAHLRPKSGKRPRRARRPPPT